MQPFTHRQLAKNFFSKPLTDEDLDLLKIWLRSLLALALYHHQEFIKQAFLFTLKNARLSSRRFNNKVDIPAFMSELSHLANSHAR